MTMVPRLRVGLAAPAETPLPPSPSGSFMSMRTTWNAVSRRRLAAAGLVVGQADPVAALAQQVPQARAQVGIVIHHQDQRLAQGLVDQAQQLREIDRLGQDLPGAGRQGLAPRCRLPA